MNISWKQNKAKYFFTLAVLAVIGCLFIYESQRKLTSQAFVNAPVISIRSPIPGKTALEQGIVVGQQLKKGQQIGVIDADTENPSVAILRSQLLALENNRGNLASEINKIDKEIAQRNGEYTSLKGQVIVQKHVDVDAAKANVTEARSELENVKFTEQEAKRNFEKAKSLIEERFISNSHYESLGDAYGRAKANRAAAQERLKRAEISLKAMQDGAQVEGPRSLPYVVTRSHMLEEQMADLSAKAEYTKKQIELLDEHIGDLKNELSQQMQARLASPVNGSVWDIISNDGDAVSQQSPVISVVNCEVSWVEAFLDESEVTDLNVGDAVKIHDYFSSEEWQGNIKSIRYGTGRVTVGQYMVEPPPEVMRRQLPVRVATLKINVDWGKSDSGNCRVGSSVKVYRES